MMPMHIGNIDASRLQALHPGDRRQAGNVTMTHTGNTLEEISLTHGEACLTVSCRKGGTIISTQFGGEELLARDAAYTDLSQATKTKGNPNVFPVFNQPLEGKQLPNARETLPNHGIARSFPWTAYTHPDCPGILILQLTSNDGTHASYPHAFTYTQLVELAEQSLTIHQRIDSDGPFAVGFHPYFRVGDKRQIEIAGIDAEAFFYLPNSLSKADKDAIILRNHTRPYVPGKDGSLNFAQGEINHHFLLRQNQPITLTDPVLHRRLIIDRSDHYQGVTVWCPEDEETAVCIEPVTDLSGHLSAKESPWLGYVRYTLETLE